MRVTTVEGGATRELRRTVLRATQQPDASMPGDDRPDALHVAAFDDDDRLVGTCLVFPQVCEWRPETPAWILRSMAVEPDQQGRGVGRVVLAEAVRLARDGGAALLWCHARGTASGFWLAAGFCNRFPDDDARQTYVEPATGVVHQDMYLVVTVEPPPHG